MEKKLVSRTLNVIKVGIRGVILEENSVSRSIKNAKKLIIFHHLVGKSDLGAFLAKSWSAGASKMHQKWTFFSSFIRKNGFEGVFSQKLVSRSIENASKMDVFLII